MAHTDLKTLIRHCVTPSPGGRRERNALTDPIEIVLKQVRRLIRQMQMNSLMRIG